MQRFASHLATGLHWRVLLLFPVVSAALACSLLAQTEDTPQKPYATLDRRAVTYRGPANATESNLTSGVAVVGAILPLHGPQESEGKALLVAAQIALEEEQARGPLPDGRKLTLAVRDESGQWGQASGEILKLIEQDHAVVLLTSADGNIAHQAEQLANKVSFPILTLASDPGTTATNVPWVFRLGPSDTDQARAFGQRIYKELGLRQVLFIAQTDHDGRIGAAEFEKVAKQFNALEPDRVEISSLADIESLRKRIVAKQPEAIVLWTDAGLANKLLHAARQTAPGIPVFVCSKATMMSMEDAKNVFVVSALPSRNGMDRSGFVQTYLARTGRMPGIGAFEAYEAVQVIATGLRASGTKRLLLRDYFAGDGKFRGAPALIPFDPAGNDTEQFAIVELASSGRHGGE